MLGGAPVAEMAAERDRHFERGARHMRSPMRGPRKKPRYFEKGATPMPVHSGRWAAIHSRTSERRSSVHELRGTMVHFFSLMYYI